MAQSRGVDDAPKVSDGVAYGSGFIDDFGRCTETVATQPAKKEPSAAVASASTEISSGRSRNSCSWRCLISCRSNRSEKKKLSHAGH